MQTITTIAVAALMLAATAMGQTHAPWPTDWNNWNDPALWCTVGEPGNVGDARYPDTLHRVYSFGSVAYTYKIGRFDVTAGQYTAFLNAVAATDPYGLYSPRMNPVNDSYGCGIIRSGSPGSYAYGVAPNYANLPVSSVSWGDAARFCNWLANGQPTGEQNLTTTEDGSYYLNGATSVGDLMDVTRKPNARFVLPTEDEWYKAAYYKGGSTDAGYWDYSTRTNTAPGQDRNDSSGNNANYSWKFYYTTVVGEFQNSSSPYGTFDQGGNVWNWNETVTASENRGIRGGSFAETAAHLQAGYRYGGYDPSQSGEGGACGFRIAYVPEPTSMALLALGALAALRKRRK